MMQRERRVRRSEFLSDALERWLDACRARGGFDALVVADHEGLLVAGSSTEDLDAAELAAHTIEPRRDRRLLRSLLFASRGETLFLGVLGKRTSSTEAFEAIRGAQRILQGA